MCMYCFTLDFTMRYNYKKHHLLLVQRDSGFQPGNEPKKKKKKTKTGGGRDLHHRKGCLLGTAGAQEQEVPEGTGWAHGEGEPVHPWESGTGVCDQEGKAPLVWNFETHWPELCIQSFSLGLVSYSILTARPLRPTEGSSVNLTCKIHPPLHKSGIQFCFFRDVQTLGSGCSRSPELQISAIWKEDSGLYWCQAKTETQDIIQKSLDSQIYVERVPVSDVSLKTQPPGGWVMKGDKLVLICLVAKGTGNITFFWYRGTLGFNLEMRSQRSLSAEFEIAKVTDSDAEQYYCAADNGFGPSLSGLVSVTVRVPVSRPILTLRTPGAQAVVGAEVELHCEALRGSPPILYRFYHEDVVLGNSSAPLGGGASFNLSLTAGHSGNYSCEAENGGDARRSDVVMLTVPEGDRSGRLTSRVIEGLLSGAGPIIGALLFCYWLKRKIERCPAKDPQRSLPTPEPQEPNYLNSPDPVQLQPLYENVNVVSRNRDDIYSLVYHIQQEAQVTAARPLRTPEESKASSDIYSWLQRGHAADVDYDDTM